MPEEQKSQIKPHNVILRSREELEISGVTDVGAFDEEGVTMATSLGDLNIRGSGLHITNLDLTTGNVCVSGRVVAIFYTDNKRRGGSVLNRLFK